VYVESESRRIGLLQMPDALLLSMRGGRGIRLVTPMDQRVALLKQEYAHFVATPALFSDRLQALTELRGKATISRWSEMAAEGGWDALIAELLETHYDPTYERSLERNFPAARDAVRLEAGDTTEIGFNKLARELRTRVETEEAIPS
jgi:tRNA 2-selenouridine synthase